MSETRLLRRDELLQGDKGGGDRGRKPSGGCENETIYAGLHPADVLVYVKGCKDAEIDHLSQVSTVAATSAAV